VTPLSARKTIDLEAKIVKDGVRQTSGLANLHARRLHAHDWWEGGTGRHEPDKMSEVTQAALDAYTERNQE
jgi:hypothetical protein